MLAGDAEFSMGSLQRAVGDVHVVAVVPVGGSSFALKLDDSTKSLLILYSIQTRAVFLRCWMER